MPLLGTFEPLSDQIADLLASEQLRPGVGYGGRRDLHRQLRPELLRLRAGERSELAAQRLVHPFELAQRRPNVATRAGFADQLEMRLFVERVDLDESFPLTEVAQQVAVQRREQLARFLHP